MLWRGANTNLHFPLLDGGGFNQIMTCQRRFLFFSNRLFKQCVEHWILCFHWYLRFIPMKFNIAHKSDLPKRKVVFRYKCFFVRYYFFLHIFICETSLLSTFKTCVPPKKCVIFHRSPGWQKSYPKMCQCSRVDCQGFRWVILRGPAWSVWKMYVFSLF